MFDLYSKPPRRQPPEPQLIPMLGVFSLITLFLIAGAVFGPSSLTLPDGLVLPLSPWRAEIETAPQISLTDVGVEVLFLKRTYHYDVFSEAQQKGEQTLQLKADIRRYLASLGQQATSAGFALHVVADRKMPYEVLFEVITLFRDSGFQSLSFISQAEGGYE